MTNIKAQVLREFGDEGADTLARYFAQIEYTAFWCIQMLIDAQGIEAVIPEGVEDVVVIRGDIHELHQIKTRDESQGPWTTADVLPILCQQYNRRNAFLGKCRYYFVSNNMADTKTALKNHPNKPHYGSLFRLKTLLAIKHDGQSFNSEEQSEWQQLEEILLPRI